MTSKTMRENPLFMRNNYETAGKWEIPIIRKQEISIDNVKLIAGSNTRLHDTPEHRSCGVHFYVDDYRFNSIYNHPERSLAKFSQYAFLLTPDYSTYADMNYWRQIESVSHSRWVGAYWQSKGLLVIPTITWSDTRSFGFCFDAVEKNCIVSVGMIGCRGDKNIFLRGYNAMLEKIEPSAVLCLGKPYKEMKGNIVSVNYQRTKKVAS